MGYSVTIVRKNNWEDINEESNITLEQWLQYVDSDEELEQPLESSLTEYNKEYYQQKPGYCEWTSHSTYKEPFARPWFDYYKGQITSENVDDETMLKMIAIAECLNAKVQGQDGEVYTEDDVMRVRVINDTVSRPQLKTNTKPWWKFW
jgi:hypothetical protein